MTILNLHRLRRTARHHGERHTTLELPPEDVMALIEVAFAAHDGDHRALADALDLFDWEDK